MITSPHQLSTDCKRFVGDVGVRSSAPPVHPLDDTARADCGSGTNSRGSSDSSGTLSNTSTEHSLSAHVSVSVPGLDIVRLGVADVAVMVDPLLKWQLNTRFRRLGLPVAETCMQSIAGVFSNSQPPAVRAQCTQVVTDLLGGKGVPCDNIDKAACQWCKIHGLLEHCKVFGYPLGKRDFDVEQLEDLVQQLQLPAYDNMREAARVVLAVALDIAKN